MQYKGVNYAIQNGYTNYAYVYWAAATPTTLVVSNAFPTLGSDDCLIFLNKSGTAVTVPTSSVLEGDLIVPGSIVANAIAANTITGDKVAAGTITGTNIAADTITASNIAAGAITASEIAANAIGANAIAAGVITGDKLVAGTITSAQLATGSVTANQIAANAVGANAIAAGIITGDKLVAGTITTTQLSSTVGSGLDLSSNESVNIKVGTVQAYIENIEDSIVRMIDIVPINGVVFKNNSVPFVTLQVKVSKGISEVSSNLTYQWYQKDVSIDSTCGYLYNSQIGPGWRRLSMNVSNVYTGITTKELTIYPDSISGTGVFRVQVQDVDVNSSTYLQYYYKDISITDLSDPIKIEVLSTGGNVFMNGVGATTLSVKVFRSDIDITTEYVNDNFRWYNYNSNGDIIPLWGGSVDYKTGLNINVTDTDVNSKATFVVNLV